MKIIVDNKIPYIQQALDGWNDDIVYLPGKDFTPEAVKDADALLIRTRTTCDRRLLEGSKVRFIGTATIGFDHIDTDYCREAGIAWSNCPGCNAGAVEQYVHAVLLLLQQQKGVDLKKACLGIVGVGHVGSHILSMAGVRMRMRVLLNDPPRKAQGESGFADLQTLARECDIITFHTPLIRDGIYRTYHLADEAFFRSLKKKPYIINTSRGEVIDTPALVRALDDGQVAGAAIDVWENEPHLDPALLRRAFIATPHIAGYSADGKANATRMVLEAFCHFFGRPIDFRIAAPDVPHPPYDKNEDIRILQQYNPQRDDEALRAHPELFEQLRGNYVLRKE